MNVYTAKLTKQIVSNMEFNNKQKNQSPFWIMDSPQCSATERHPVKTNPKKLYRKLTQISEYFRLVKLF